MVLDQVRTEVALSDRPSDYWIGRRVRALCVLSQMAGLSDAEIGQLTAGDVIITGGTAMITPMTRTATGQAATRAPACGPCALARWMRVLEMTFVYGSRAMASAVIARAGSIAGIDRWALIPTRTRRPRRVMSPARHRAPRCGDARSGPGSTRARRNHADGFAPTPDPTAHPIVRLAALTTTIAVIPHRSMIGSTSRLRCRGPCSTWFTAAITSCSLSPAITPPVLVLRS